MATATLTKPNIAASNGNFHWTVEKLYRAFDANVFDEPKRIELVEGSLWEKEKVNPPHANTTERIARRFRATLEPAFQVREEKPVSLSADTEPIPDVAVVIERNHEYSQRHPGSQDILLLVEVADSSVERDTGEKALLYARAGIADYWVSLVGMRQLWVYRNPTENGYAETLRLDENDTISLLAAPDVEISVRALLTPAVVASPIPND